MSRSSFAGENLKLAPHLILASASPRRRGLLHAAGYDFEVHPADIDEEDYPAKMLPADLAQRLAVLKAQAIAEKFPEAVVLAADTVVAFGDRPLGKPADEADAARMLTLLSGTTHIVITGVAVEHRAKSFNQSARMMSAVRMRSLTKNEIRAYVESGDWKGKAGGYGIQDERRDPFVTRMTGSQTNIVGLPMKKTMELLKAAGILPARAPATGFSDR
jgi:septum formation protein